MPIINAFPEGGGGGIQYIVPTEAAMLSLPTSAFMSANAIEKVYFPSCTTIGSYAFYSCSSLTEVSFPVCTTIDNYAFCRCSSLTEASFPACTTIGREAFEYCSSLTEASFPVCTTISSSAFLYTTGSLYLGAYSNSTIYTIFGKSNATSASSSAYWSYIQISSIEIPAITSLAHYAFYSASKLQTVKAVNCTTIGSSAFYYCSSLAEAYFPNCTTIGNYTFTSVPAYITIGVNESITSTFALCFFGIGSTYYSNTTSCTNNKKLIGINLINATTIPPYAFFYAKQLSEIQASNCTIISGSAFNNCIALTHVSIPNCTTIANRAFYNCNTLPSASFPQCSSIGTYAFYNCKNLSALYLLNSTVATLGNYALTSTPFSDSTYLGYFGSIYVPSSLVDSYKTAANWSAYANRITAYIE